MREVLIQRMPERMPEFLKTASRQMAVNAYVPLYFSSFLVENKTETSRLKYEMEYLLAGKKSDRENLKEAVNQVLTLRGAMNLLFLLKFSG